LSESASHRADLASLEAGEARDHAIVSLLLAASAAVLVLLTGFAVTLLLASLAWDSPHRLAWLILICVVYLGSTVAASLVLVRRLRTWRPLEETQKQIKEDLQCLGKLIKAAL